MFGLKVFVQIQTFRRMPFVPLHNFCHATLFFHYTHILSCTDFLHLLIRVYVQCAVNTEFRTLTPPDLTFCLYLKRLGQSRPTAGKA